MQSHEQFDRDLHTIMNYAENGQLSTHSPEGSWPYYKAIDLAHIALHLSGVTVWSTESPIRGASLSIRKQHATEYLGAHHSLTLNVVEASLDAKFGFPSTKIVIGLSSRVKEFVSRPDHWGHEAAKGELITSSMQLSDIDPSSQRLVREVLQVESDFNTELVQGDHKPSTTTTSTTNSTLNDYSPFIRAFQLRK